MPGAALFLFPSTASELPSPHRVVEAKELSLDALGVGISSDGKIVLHFVLQMKTLSVRPKMAGNGVNTLFLNNLAEREGFNSLLFAPTRMNIDDNA